jgi:hypothetical protein
VADVIEGDLKDLSVKIYGMAASNPKEFTKTLKAKIIGNKLSFKLFNTIAYRWTSDQYKLFGTIQDTKCDGPFKMPESDFVEAIIAELQNYIPTFTDLYHADELKNEPWDMKFLKDKLKALAEKGKLIVEPKVRRAREEKTTPTKIEANKASNWQQYEYEEQQDPRYQQWSYYTYPVSKGAKGGKGKGGKGGKGGDGKGKGGKGGKGGDGKGKGGKSDRKRWASDGGGYGNEWGSTDWTPKKEMWCTICEYWGRTWNATGHEKETCQRSGGGMEGYSLEDCLQEQRRLNAISYETRKSEVTCLSEEELRHAQGAAV